MGWVGQVKAFPLTMSADFVCVCVCVCWIANYTKFLVKPRSKDRLRVAPMEHGHLMSAPFLQHRYAQTDTDRHRHPGKSFIGTDTLTHTYIHDNRRLLDAAVRVQSSFRSFQDRKVAELAARFAAYQEVRPWVQCSAWNE